MSFSGDGEEWTEWILYVTSYDGFNIASGEFGTSIGEGLKYVYGRFKDLDENILFGDEVIYDSIIYTLPLPPTKGSVVIANGDESTDDSTPFLAIYSEGADYMSFSGDGEQWTDWVPYAESYEDFDIASGECGTEFSQGEKNVYVRFKNETDITMKVNTSQVFLVKGINYNLEEVPLDGSKVSWRYCCNASTTPLKGSVTTTYTTPSGTGDKFLQATYDEKYKKSAWITVIN
jgi:hypothetical protein